MFGKFLCCAILVWSASAWAAFPEKPVRIYVPNQPGGPVDVMARVLAERLSAKWGQSVVVDNKPGASGIVMGQALAKSAPDGYTLGMVVESAMAIMPFTVEKLPYDPMKDLQPMMVVARTPFLYVVAADSPLRSWQDLVDQSKKRELKIGSWGIGTAFHMVWELTARRAGIRAQYVPSPTSTKTQTDLIGGVLDVALDAPSSARGLLDGGRLRPLAITSPQRFSGLPETPTLSESGLAGFAPQPWIGLMSPTGVLQERVQVIHQAISEVLQEPDVVRRMETLGMIPIASTPQEHAATIERSRKEMAPLIKELGIRLQ